MSIQAHFSSPALRLLLELGLDNERVGLDPILLLEVDSVDYILAPLVLTDLLFCQVVVEPAHIHHVLADLDFGEQRFGGDKLHFLLRVPGFPFRPVQEPFLAVDFGRDRGLEDALGAEHRGELAEG